MPLTGVTIGWRSNTPINRTIHMLRTLQPYTELEYREATQIWHTCIISVRMDNGEHVAKLEVLGEPVPCLGGEV